MTGQSQIDSLSIEDANARILQFLQTAQYAEAESLCYWLIEQNPSLKNKPYFYLGVALQFQGKLPLALKTFETALEVEPRDTNVMQAIASCLEQLGELELARKHLQAAVSISPEDSGVLANLGAVSEKLRNPTDASDYYHRALAINPKNYIALMNYGALLNSTGKRQEGLTMCLRAYEAHPQSLGVIYNLVNALVSVFQYSDALTYCNEGLTKQPNHANLLFKKGLVLSCLQQYAEATQCMAYAQVLDPNVLRNALLKPSQDPLIEYHLVPELLYLDAMYQAQTKCYWVDRPQYLSEFSRALSGKPGFINNIEFAFHVLSLSLNAKERLKISQNAAELIRDITWLKGVPPFVHNKPVKQKIRLGYYSSDFRAHPTGLLSRLLYELHDKENFEIYIYSTFNDAEPDKVRLSVEKYSDVFRDVSMQNDQSVAQRIFDDKIDILVDLNGYTAKSRSCVMAMRPAPLQVQYLAYLQTMGVDFIDYTILDTTICPDALEAHWQEKIAKLPDSLYLYDTDTSNSPVVKTRKDYGLPEDAIIFCCLNTPYKIEPQIFDVWMAILHAVPNSVLWLLGADELIMTNLEREASDRGIAKDRIVFAEPLPNAEHLLRYQVADLFIDTYWCGAHTTALDALWQGLPVLCCVGEVSSSRVGASFLQVLEMPELIASDFTQYQDKAIYYANNPAALSELKSKLADKRTTSPLFNIPQTVKHIEMAYKMMWQRYQDGLPPATFDVPNLRLID